MREPQTRTKYGYDQMGNLIQLQKVISGTTYTTSYVFNYAGELTSITYPSGRVIAQGIDPIGRLASVKGTLNSVQTTYASGYAYNSANQLLGLQYGNNVYASLGYSSDRLQLTCLDYSTTNRNGTGCSHDSTTKFGLSYAYGTAGANNSLISTITDSADNGRSASYTYDSLYRLSTAVTTGSTSYPQWGLSWGYDRYGNRLNQTLTAGSGYQGSVTVDATTNHITGSPYAYDSNGNLLDDGTSTLVYDAENRITTAQNGSASGTYSYDGNSLRVKKVAGSTTTVYIFSSSKVIAEYDNGAAVGSPSREYVYSGARLLAKLDSTGTKYYHQDHLSNRLVTDSSGNTTEQTGHFPFGDSWYNANNEKLVFTSYERDAESGNDYAMARYYVSRLGRFSSADLRSGSVDNPQSLNRYAYVLNNPLNFLDPFGLDPCSSAGDCAGGGGGGGAPCDTEVYTTDDNGNLVVTITPCPVDFTNSPFPDPFGNGADSGGPNFPSGGGPAISNDLQKQINCAMGLEMTKKDSAAVDRANAIWDTIQTAGDTHGIDPSLLAAVAVRESGVQNIPEKGGKGRGRFQIDLGQHPGVTAEQAQDLAFSANYAAGILSSNMNSLAARLPNFTQEQLLHATAASYNLGAGKKGISGNPDTIDAGSPFGNYGSTVMLLMDCF